VKLVFVLLLGMLKGRIRGNNAKRREDQWCVGIGSGGIAEEDPL
jgi:hypothetical protein